jgi:hypothetical protein
MFSRQLAEQSKARAESRWRRGKKTSLRRRASARDVLTLKTDLPNWRCVRPIAGREFRFQLDRGDF